MRIVLANQCHRDDWLRMRMALWPECLPAESANEISTMLAGGRETAFIALDETGKAVGFVEVSTRDYVDGGTTSPVGFIEGIYVDPHHRNAGVGSMLVHAAEAWSRERGCTELGSDTHIDNSDSIAFHRAAGFREVERQVVFLKQIAP